MVMRTNKTKPNLHIVKIADNLDAVPYLSSLK